MSRYPGKLTSDVYGILVDEMRVAHIGLSAAQTVASDPDGLIDAKALTAAAQTITTFENDMPYARNITVVASAATTSVVTIYGTNLADDPISESITMDGASAKAGAKAFKTVTSIVLPIAEGVETVDVGWGEKLGLPYMMATKPLAFALDDGAIETTAPVVTVDSDELEKNVIDLHTDMDGSVIDIFLVI